MFLDLIQHEYFWLSFFPVSFLGVGFWFLFFERSRKTKDPLMIFVVALMGGVLSALLLQIFLGKIPIENSTLTIWLEELFKLVCAIGVMEIFRQKFKTVAGGIVFGFAVGLGFALAENLFYLESVYNQSGEFSADFWLTFQGRFWGSTLLHGSTTAVFGLFYAGTYLSQTIFKNEEESALKVLLAPFAPLQSFRTLTFPATRALLFLNREEGPHLKKLTCRMILLEGAVLTFLLHWTFNLIVENSSPVIAFFLAFLLMWGLRKKMEKI